MSDSYGGGGVSPLLIALLQSGQQQSPTGTPFGQGYQQGMSYGAAPFGWLPFMPSTIGGMTNLSPLQRAMMQAQQTQQALGLGAGAAGSPWGLSPGSNQGSGGYY